VPGIDGIRLRPVAGATMGLGADSHRK
jgi:hypothetical protein